MWLARERGGKRAGSWLGAPPQRGRERRGSRTGRTEPPCGAGGLGDREEGRDRGVVADLALGVRERVGDLVARRRLLEDHLVRVDGVEREADVDADVAHAAADRAPLEDARDGRVVLVDPRRRQLDTEDEDDRRAHDNEPPDNVKGGGDTKIELGFSMSLRQVLARATPGIRPARLAFT